MEIKVERVVKLYEVVYLEVDEDFDLEAELDELSRDDWSVVEADFGKPVWQKVDPPVYSFQKED